METKVYLLDLNKMSVEEADRLLRDDVQFIKESVKQGNEFTLQGFQQFFNNYIGVETEGFYRPDYFIRICE